MPFHDEIEEQNTKAQLVLSDTAPSSATALLQRLVVREPKIDPIRARVILESAGVKASPATCSMVISEAKRMLRYLGEAKLLVDDFDRRRRWQSSDFDEVETRRRRRLRDR